MTQLTLRVVVVRIGFSKYVADKILNGKVIV